MTSPGLAKRVIRALSWLVPVEVRREWVEEWHAELDALVAARAAGGPYPRVARFAGGALPHALWLRSREWSMDSLLQDLRYAWRGLRRTPVFTFIAAATLALGIGANGLIFSFVNGMTLRPPAGILEPDRLVQVGRSYDDAPRWDTWAWPAAAVIVEESRTFAGAAGFQSRSVIVGRGTEVEQVLAEYVTGGYFTTLGVPPLLGRVIQPSDDVVARGHPVVVLSHSYWTRRFGGDPSVVGRTLPVGSVPYEIIGVVPQGFAGTSMVGSSPQLWIPAVQILSPERAHTWNSSWLNVVARLQDGVTEEQGRAGMELVTTRIRSLVPDQPTVRALMEPGVGLTPEARRVIGRVTMLLFGLVGLVLLLTCANVANLFLARGAGRAGEVGIRLALGAGRLRLTRQLVTESLLVALLATLMAVPLVASANAILPHLLPGPVAASLAPDARVFVFLAVVGLLAGVLFGTAPAWTAVSGDLMEALRLGRGGGNRRRARLRDALVVVQLAISLGLVAVAAMLGRSAYAAHTADPGFAPDGMIVGFVNVAASGRYGEAESLALVDRLLQELRSEPWVAAVTVANQAPVAGGHTRATVVPAEQADDDEAGFEAEYIAAGPDYFTTLGIPVVRGRALGGLHDETESVVVINEALAARFWPGQDPLGKLLAGQGDTWRVVGVVRDVQMRTLRADPNPGVYYPFHRSFDGDLAVHVRVLGASPPALRQLRETVARVDVELPVGLAVDLREAVTESVQEVQVFGMLVAGFAVLALILAAIGLYGLVAFGVTQRQRELGIRLALGAEPGALVGLILRRSLLLAGLGVLGGLAVAVVLVRAIEGMLFGVTPGDPRAFAAAAGLMLVVALAAAWLPARRAARVDAVESLRTE